MYRGHVEGDPHFWGDYCRDKVKYVRNFVFGEINTLKVCPWMPYHDPDRPYVRYWFAASEGPLVDSFNRMLCEKSQDCLEAEGGACIVYTHFAKGFQEDGRLHPRFVALMQRLSRKNGWFVPVADLLDYLLERKKDPNISRAGRAQLERAWLLHKMCVGRT